MLKTQDDRNLKPVIQEAGCCFLTCLAMEQLYVGVELEADQINFLFDIAETLEIVRKDAYVLDLEKLIALPLKYGMLPQGMPIRLLGSTPTQAESTPVMAVPCTVLFIQKQIVAAPREHFILYYYDASLAYNPKPGYMIEGKNTWYYWGIKY